MEASAPQPTVATVATHTHQDSFAGSVEVVERASESIGQIDLAAGLVFEQAGVHLP